MMYVDTHTMQKSPRTNTKIQARYMEPATDTQDAMTKKCAAVLDTIWPVKVKKKNKINKTLGFNVC